MANDYTSRLNEISGALAEARAYTEVALTPSIVFPQEGVAGCLARLAANLPYITGWLGQDSDTDTFLTSAMKSYVTEVGTIFNDLFVPADFSAIEGESLVATQKRLLDTIGASLMNPAVAVLATQRKLVTESLQRMKDLIYSNPASKDKGLLNQYAERGERLFQSLFLEHFDFHVGGMFLNAVLDGIPAIDMEFTYLRKLKQLARTGLEDVANLPDILRPELMNTAVSDKMCCGEQHMINVENALRRDNIFDRKEWAKATKCVCAAKDMLFNGKVDQDFIEYHAGNIVGLSQAQIKSLTSLQFLPDPRFRINIQLITSYTTAFERTDADVRTLHNNLLLIIDTLDAVADTRIGDILALMVQVIREQVTGVRADLAAQSQGFSGYQDALAEDAVRKADLAALRSAKTRAEIDLESTTYSSAEYKSGLDAPVPPRAKGAAFGPPQVDIYAYLTAQATAYTVLSAACFLMQQTSSLYSVLDKVLSAESTVIKTLRGFVGDLKVKCPGAFTGMRVVEASKTYVSRLEDRLNGKTTENEAVRMAAADMLDAIKEHEQFLRCFKSQLSGGSKTMERALTAYSAVANISSSVGAMLLQLKQIARLYPQIRQSLRTMDLARLMGLDGQTYSALDAAVGALQCLLAQCDNPYISELTSTAVTQFRREYAKNRATAVTMGSLDEVPKSGMLAIVLKKAQAAQRLIQMINSLLNFNIKDLCAIKTPAFPQPTKTVADRAKAAAVGKPQDLIVDTAPWRKPTLVTPPPPRALS